MRQRLKPREVGGLVSRCTVCFVWVSYDESETEEFGTWLQVSKVQAREILDEAREEDRQICVFTEETGEEIYIGCGNDPFDDEGAVEEAEPA